MKTQRWIISTPGDVKKTLWSHTMGKKKRAGSQPLKVKVNYDNYNVETVKKNEGRTIYLISKFLNNFI